MRTRTVRTSLVAAIAFALAIFGFTLAGAPSAQAASQAARVTSIVDGDTIKVKIGNTTETVRIIGIDAPESGRCGSTQATARLSQLIANKSIVLSTDSRQPNRDRYNRLLRVVRVGSTDPARTLVTEGRARELTVGKGHATKATYVAAQNAAKKAKRGIWASVACTNDSALAAKPAPVKAAPKPPAPTTGCKIKGNISSSGEKIYHVPGGKSYNATVIDTKKGERMFCKEADAVKAGWRKAKV